MPKQKQRKIKLWLQARFAFLFIALSLLLASIDVQAHVYIDGLNAQRDTLSKTLAPPFVIAPLTQEVDGWIGYKGVQWDRAATLHERRMVAQTIMRDCMLDPHKNFFAFNYYPSEGKLTLPPEVIEQTRSFLVTFIAVKFLESYASFDEVRTLGAAGLFQFLASFCQRLATHKDTALRTMTDNEALRTGILNGIEKYTQERCKSLLTSRFIRWYGDVSKLYPKRSWAGMEQVTKAFLNDPALIASQFDNFIQLGVPKGKTGAQVLAEQIGTDNCVDRLRTFVGLAGIQAFFGLEDKETDVKSLQHCLSIALRQKVNADERASHPEKVRLYNEILGLHVSPIDPSVYFEYGSYLYLYHNEHQGSDSSPQVIRQLFQKAQGYPLCDQMLELFKEQGDPIFTAEAEEADVKGEQPSVAAQILEKPAQISDMSWLKQLGDARAIALYSYDFQLFEAYTREMCQTIAWKYGPLKGKRTPAEQQVRLLSIFKTRQFYASKPNILDDFYFGYNAAGCWQQLAENTVFAAEMAVVAAVDATCWGLLTDRDVFDSVGAFAGEKRGQDVFYTHLYAREGKRGVSQQLVQEITQIVVDVHDDGKEDLLRQMMKTLPPQDWGALITQASLIADTQAPYMDVRTIFNIMANPENQDYRGWQLYGFKKMRNWFNSGSPDRQFTRKLRARTVQNMDFVVHSLFRNPVLLTDDLRGEFNGLSADCFNGQHIAFKYVFYLPAMGLSAAAEKNTVHYFYLYRQAPADADDITDAPSAEYFDHVRKIHKHVMRTLGDSLPTPEKKLETAAQLGYGNNAFSQSLTSAGYEDVAAIKRHQLLDADRGLNEALFHFAEAEGNMNYMKMAAITGHKAAQLQCAKAFLKKRKFPKALHFFGLAGTATVVEDLLSEDLAKLLAGNDNKERGAQKMIAGERYKALSGLRKQAAASDLGEANYQYALMCTSGAGGKKSVRAAEDACIAACQRGYGPARSLFEQIESSKRVSNASLTFTQDLSASAGSLSVTRVDIMSTVRAKTKVFFDEEE